MRERVLRRFSIDDRFTLVSAMPGYGKTAAVRQWIDTVEVPVAWLSLDLLDKDPLSFWSNVLLALGSAVPGIEVEPGMLLWSAGSRIALFLERVGRGAGRRRRADRAGARWTPRRPGSRDGGWLGRTGRAGGDIVRVVATTRTDPPLPLARWRALGWLNDLREDSLRLTDEEAVSIAQRADTSFRTVPTWSL